MTSQPLQGEDSATRLLHWAPKVLYNTINSPYLCPRHSTAEVTRFLKIFLNIFKQLLVGNKQTLLRLQDFSQKDKGKCPLCCSGWLPIWEAGLRACENPGRAGALNHGWQHRLCQGCYKTGVSAPSPLCLRPPSGEQITWVDADMLPAATPSLLISHTCRTKGSHTVHILGSVCRCLIHSSNLQ